MVRVNTTPSEQLEKDRHDHKIFEGLKGFDWRKVRELSLHLLEFCGSDSAQCINKDYSKTARVVGLQKSKDSHVHICALTCMQIIASGVLVTYVNFMAVCNRDD